MYLTLFLIITTSIVSFVAFNNHELFNKLKFNAYLVWHKKNYARLLSHALIHNGWLHLIINMYVLWMFGSEVEKVFSSKNFFPETFELGKFFYVLMYVIAIPAASIPSLLRYRNQHYYNSVGASGAVSAVVFAFILFAPKAEFWFGIPAYIFGMLYLIYSYFMSRRKNDNIAHDAHFVGSVFGLLFPIVLNPDLIQHFILSITN